tara:strand:- start:2165 stop:3751 length:1587 start_codon:yes stop_codon:yes gene_type:complete
MKPIKALFFLSILISLLSCSTDSNEENVPKINLVKTIIINGNSIQNGASEQLSVVVLPNNASNRAVTWSVDDTSIALISDKGLVTPLQNGSVTITATAQDESGISAQKILTISGVVGPPKLIESITIIGADITDGKPLQLAVEVAPLDATNKSITWSVSDSLLAGISTSGLVTPKDNGTIIITATAKDGSQISNEFTINISGVTPIYATNLRAENMLLWQRNNGGWPKEPYNDFSGYDREQTVMEKETAIQTKENTDTTIDNDHTVGELRHLLSAYKTTHNPNYLQGALKAIDYLLSAQYANGGWPQYYPDMSGYRHQITYNDNAMVNVMNLMWDISKSKNNTDVIESAYIEKAIIAFNKGISILLQTQIIVNGKKTAWCAQHDEISLLPATARSYELPSISGSESVGIVRTLMLVENPSAGIIQAVNDAVAWFEEAKLFDIATQKINDPSQPTGEDVIVVSSPGNVLWARFYDLDTNLPFFCGRDGIKKNTLAEIENERRTGYAWYGNWPTNLIDAEYTAWKAKNGL